MSVSDTEALIDENTIVIGPCRCGGYGQVFNEKAEAEIGRCHIPLSEIVREDDIGTGIND